MPEGKNSWALPLRHERITSWESPISKAAWQLKQLLKHYHHKALVLLDREYGNAKWVNATVKLKVDCVMRIRSNTCLWGTPPAYSGRGRPRKHGQKWQLTATEHWNSPDELLELVTSSYGRVRAFVTS